MPFEIGRKLYHLSFGKLKMAEDDIARLLQNVDFEEKHANTRIYYHDYFSLKYKENIYYYIIKLKYC
jgi:hypothetical protein